MKKIVVDCRYLGMSGIGRVLENVLINLLKIEENEYILWGRKEKIEKFNASSYIFDDVSPFSSKSMKNKNVKEINKNDVLFTPNFILPFGLKIKVVSMIHDLLFLDMPEVNKGFVERFLKKYLLKRAMKKSSHVLTVSRFTKKRIDFHFKKYASKASYCYIGVSDDFKDYSLAEKKDQIIFVGNIKRQKGLKTLLEAYENITKYKLVIVGDDSNFRNGDKEVIDLIKKMNIEFTGYIGDDELKKRISESKFLIQPSTYEGFGVPPLEALYLGTRPIISNIEVFNEVYKDLPVVFFDGDLENKINNSDYNFTFDKESTSKKYSYENFTKEVCKYL